ncbi:hypothetical protein TruAng_007483 [Truncatella angustata]|nr:hypothetical protein TruAng_007483 [Truncatella angustata]
MGRVKTAGLKPFKCEKCGPSFGNERALGQHINSEAHALMINPDKNIPSIAPSPPVAFGTPFKPPVPGPIDFDGTPENEVDIPRKDNSTFYILTALPGKGQGLIEMTISYADTGTFENRRRHLKKSFPFDYTCKLCSLLEAARPVIDNRQSEITRLDELLGDGSRLLSNPAKCLEDVHTLLKLLEAENITDARVPRAYYDALQIAIAYGDQARAKVFA